MTEKQFRACGLILIVIALLFILAGLSVGTAYGQETRRPSGRLKPGPDSTATPTPTATPSPTPAATPTRTPVPTATPVPIAPKCEWVQTPWGGSHCDVREVCTLLLMPMHIGVPRPVYGKIITDETDIPTEKLLATDQWPAKLSVEWESTLKFIEWYVRGSGEEYGEHPIMGCYCDERQNIIVICQSGQVARVVSQ